MKNKFIHIIRTKPVFLYLLPLFFVLHGFTENYDLIPVKDAVILALFYTGVALLIALLFWLLYRNFRKANLIVFLMLSYQFFFGSVYDFLKKNLHESFLTRYSFILPVTLLIFLFAIIFLKKTKRPLLRITLYLNMLLLLLILTDTGWLMLKAGKKQNISVTVNEIFTPCDICKKPDIYLIIADGYPGRIELRDIFNYDNSSFENELKKRKFYLVDSSSSNYNFTPFSVSSMFDMSYLRGLAGSNTNKNDISLCYNTLKKSKLMQFLRKKGYEFYNYSIFDFIKQPSLARPTFLPRKTGPLTSQTFSHRLIRDLGYHLVTTFKLPSSIRQLRNADLTNNNKLFSLTIETAGKFSDKPRFVYTHLVMPHYPYYFDSSGKVVPYKLLTDESPFDKKAFIGYLQYGNKKYLELIDHLLSSSATPPIIILIGDHGFREFKDSVESKYHFMNLNAVLLPDSNYSGFYKGQSNVNQFRIILNSQFGQHLPLLKDSTSFLTE